MTFFDQGSNKKAGAGPTLGGSSDTGNAIGPAIFRVQTIPQKKGVLEFKVQYREPEEGSAFEDSFTYNTTTPYPYGITYAVFGSRDTSAATYTIRDGSNLF